MTGEEERIRELERAISELPKGYISVKNINGKQRHYLQWREGSKIRSKYIRKDDVEKTVEAIEQRRRFEAMLSELSGSGDFIRTSEFDTNVIIGGSLDDMSHRAEGYGHRDCYKQLKEFVFGDPDGRVCILYGLRRTGKTTMLCQLMLDMSPEELSRTAYMKIRMSDTMASVNRDMKRLHHLGFRTVLVDEATLMKDFIDSAALFSDVYAAMGMKIVMSGTDSLGFRIAMDQELYDRAMAIPTTYIPFSEHSRLLGIGDVDDYIEFGGTLRAGELNFDDPELRVVDASFRDDESTHRYIDTSICRNIQNSLSNYDGGGHFRHLRDLYETDELTNAINRIIQDMNHRFLASVISGYFTSHDLGSAAQSLRADRDSMLRTDVLDRVDVLTVTGKLMRILGIKSPSELKVGITDAHIVEIKEYLSDLDLIEECPIETTSPEPLEPYILFTQPGMRYCQAQALVHSLMSDPEVSSLSEKEKGIITGRILDQVRGRMLEDIVLLDTIRSLPENKKAFRMQFKTGEFDMAVYDRCSDTCEIYEIEHSRVRSPHQYRHLVDQEKCEAMEKRFGRITGRFVLYRGEDHVCEENDVRYLNVENYLSALPVKTVVRY